MVPKAGQSTTKTSSANKLPANWTSPNFDERALPISMLVLHYTGMQNARVALERLCDPKAKVSAHYVVNEDGQIFSLVPETKRTWHAGLSSWHGIVDVNSASIGVEIVNGGHEFGLPAFADTQIKAVIMLCQDILKRHAILPGNVVGHNEIAPGRKQDPGERFPWMQLARAGIGLWPDINQSPPHANASRYLQDIGYCLDENLQTVLIEFQRRYRPCLIDGVLDDETLRLLASAHGLTTPLTAPTKPG